MKGVFMNVRVRGLIVNSCLALVVLGVSACGGGPKKERDFFTSGSREADQRAEQHMAKADQLRGKDTGKEAPAKLSLYDRLGGETGVRTIVDDFVARVMADPQVNWERKGVTTGGLLNKKDRTWHVDGPKLEMLKKHLTQFIALKTGGPSKYEGRDIGESHKDMKITNSEFDAAIGDMKATLDKAGVKQSEQKDLLAILESTRPQIVEKR
jgi:truncated hemoglobin YjbI